MTFSTSALQSMASAMSERGVFSLSLREVEGGVDIEINDPIHTVESLATELKLTASTIRNMERIGILHATKTRGRGGSLRFRLSRVHADLNRAENMR